MNLARLRSVLAHLPTADLPPRVLNVGCGDYVCAQTLHGARPGWARFGVDLDGAALRRAHQRDPALRLVHSDARCLPGLVKGEFGLVLVRHPDLFRSQAAWTAILPVLPGLVAPGGGLVITVYAADEADLLRSMLRLPPDALDAAQITAPDLAGHDRFVFVYRMDGHG